MESTLHALGIRSPGQSDPLLPPQLPAGPLSGRMFCSGRLTGSSSAPRANLRLRIEQGAIGGTGLAQAQVGGRGDAEGPLRGLLGEPGQVGGPRCNWAGRGGGNMDVRGRGQQGHWACAGRPKCIGGEAG